MIGPQEQLSGSLIIIELTKIYRLFHWKFLHFEKRVLEGVFAHITLDALVISYHHQNTGHKITTEEETSNRTIAEIVGLQEQLEGSLIIIGLTKIYRFFLWKFVNFEKSVLE